MNQRHQNENLGNRFLRPNYIVAQANCATTAAPEATPSLTVGLSQPDTDEAGPHRPEMHPFTEEDYVDYSSRPGPILTTPTRPTQQSESVPRAVPVTTPGPVTREMKDKSTDAAPQPSK